MASVGGHALLDEVVGELDDEDAVGEGDADQHDDAHEGHDVERGAPEEEGEQDSAECGGKGEEDEEGIGKGAELRDEDEIEQEDGEDEANREAVEGGVHRLDAAGEAGFDAVGDLGGVEDLVDGGGDAAEVLLLRSDVDVHAAADLGVVELGGGVELLDGRDHVEAGGTGDVVAVERDRLEVVDGLDLAFLVHDAEEVVVAAVGIDPDAGGDHDVRGEGGDDVGDDLLLGHAEFAGAGAVDRELE